MPPLQSKASKAALIFACSTLGLDLSGGASAQVNTAATSSPKVEVAKLVDKPDEQESIGEDDLPIDANQGLGVAPDEANQDSASAITDDNGDVTPEPPPAILPPGVPPDYSALQLDVKVNGTPTFLIVAFFQSPAGKLGTTREELKALRISLPGEGPENQFILLDDIPSVAYTYNDFEQSVDIRIAADLRTLQDIKTSEQKAVSEADSSNGFLLNYSLFSAFNTDYGMKNSSVSGLSATLEGRAFTKFGTLDVSGIIATPDFEVANTTRLDTTFYFDDPKRAMEYRLGDVISGGTNWSRPVRLGGGQMRRNFDMRQDLITMPLPDISGTAGVPSTLDVYVGGVKAYSGDVDQGPFRIDSLPVFSSETQARVVLTDAAGQKVEAEGEFFTSPDLLVPGLFDFSAEVGFLRQGYGARSFDYDEYPVVIGSMRLGMTHLLTAEAHAEASEDLQNGGLGVLTAIPHFGTLNVAGAASLYDNEVGFLFYGSWEKRYGDLFIRASTTRTIGDYQDLASVNAFELQGDHAGDVPKALDQIGVGYSLPEHDINMSASVIHALKNDGERDVILSGNITRDFGSFTVAGSGFINFGDDDYGVSIGFSMPLGRNMNSSSEASLTSRGYQVGSTVSKSHTEKKYSTAWTATYEKQDQHRLTGSSETRTPVGAASTDISLNEDSVGGTVAFSGAVVAARETLLFGPRIGDSFAIVDTGAPGVKVKHESRYVGASNSKGKLLVPNVAPYARNRFDVDLEDMALTAETPESEKYVIPRARAGILVDFKVNSGTKAAILQLKDKDGSFVPLSTEIFLDGNPEAFIMGYDGEVYVTGLTDNNLLTVKLPAADCKVEFTYTGSEQEQAFIGPLTCV